MTQMTNRLLATVMAFAFSTGIAAHAAQDPRHPLPGITVSAVQGPTVTGHTVTAPKLTLKTDSLPAATSLPQALQIAANQVSGAATAAVDPAAAVRAAAQRDHVALEHLRQLVARLKGPARRALNQRISEDEARLVDIEKTALASRSGGSSIKAMDDLVAAVDKALANEEAREHDNKSNDNSNHQSGN
ncbi:MAG: hypothetical protein M3077_05380 [Candidatus Dormibacteraeota bacterium]|nr:hypothetical protein [Candidatus Dormibacteraeota bacterium]